LSVPVGRRGRWAAVARSAWFKVGASVVAAGLLVTGAILSSGYDVAQTKVDDSSVWALQAGQGERYARVDTALGQLDTVKDVARPSDLVQADGHVLLYSQNDAKVASVDLAQPEGYTASSSGFDNTPEGTTAVVHTGDYVGYLTATGAVHAARVEDGTKSTPAIPAPGSDGTRPFSADTIAIGTDGVLYAYSHTSHTVLRFDVRTGRTLGTDAVAGGPSHPGANLTAVGDTWVLLGGDGKVWIRGLRGSVAVGAGGRPVLQQPSEKRVDVVVATSSSLFAFRLKDGRRTRLAGGFSGAVAAPTWNGSRLYAAWVPEGSGPGSLWVGRRDLAGRLSGAARSLDYSGDGRTNAEPPTLQQTAEPVFRGNGSAMILNDDTSGWVWSVPSGRLVQGSQNWDLDPNKVTEPTDSNSATNRETDPRPPVAVDDAFGVRAGSLVSLPVMLNDYDANGDVLTIVPGSLTGLDPGFGAASIANSAQTVTVQLSPSASGQASFQYTVTDGTASGGGLKSAPATVTLTVSPPSSNEPPLWCNGASPCLYNWPDGVGVAPGGSVEVPVLRGWVDPDGDPMFAQSDATGPDYTVSVSPDGELVFQAAANAQARSVAVPVTISDVNGATAQKVLHVTITDQPSMQVENFGLMTAQNVPITVNPAPHIRGAKGAPRIASATLASSNSADGTVGSSDATITVDSAGATFDFAASAPGSYPVTMTIDDTATDATATATVRITVVPPDQPLLSTSPVTVFVRPQTDTSVDVFSAVQNPTGRVLLLSGPQPRPAEGASLDVDVVGESQLRVRGTTASGGPGLLGTVSYTVNDGSNSPDMQVTGIATVYLLPDLPPSRPVAINDSVTVRAGAQVDIPVLANDIGANGDIVQLDPSSIQDPSHQGLAFASGQVLRFLAPDAAPTQPLTLRYSAYAAGNPAAKSEATVTVTVLPTGGNRPPQPTTLTGRVTAGASVRIPFDPYGVDPDGDMVTLDRIMTQPDGGTAQLSSDGTAIVFTALADAQGQQSFTYRVRDSEGETGTATVMIGVLNAQTDPAPVTFSDYVQVQAGDGNQVVVEPTANDVDPTGGTLSLVGVAPDATQGTALYELLKQSIKSQDDAKVVITSTPNPRTLTYTYSVKNAQGDVSVGLIVVDVVSGHVPDYPVAVDTVVDAQHRAHLADGIDVVAGKVSWGAGDVSGLKLSLYKPMDGVSVSGSAIRVAHVPASGLLVPFKLSGADFTGQQATTYGFLRVPALADVVLALKANAKPLKVNEGDQASVDLKDIVSVPPGSMLQAQAGDTKTIGARKGADCTIEGTRLRYDAGTGAPWTDACLAPVRLIGQDEYTIVPVPIQIIPKQPEPELRPASLTASPGQAPVAFNLTQMTTWLGHSDLSGLAYRLSYHGQLFKVTQSGDSISVRANDTAQPGLEEVAEVTIVGHSGVGTSADITLKVGPAPSTRPAGGSVSLSCSEAQGSSCSATVVGLPDEVNAYSGTPLKVVSVVGSVTGCTGVTFSVASDRSIQARWGADAPGGVCTVPFAVQDAQGKRSEQGVGDGKLSFELKGYPAPPTTVAQVAYSVDSVTLAVTPGAASSAYPALTGFQIYLDGSASVMCDANGACPPVKGLANGEKHTFQAKSVNSVGESRTGVQTTGWAFAQPVISGVTAQPVYDPNVTSPSVGAFDVTIPNSDATAARYRVDWAGQSETVDAGSGPNVKLALSAPAGTPTSVTVTPISEFPQPPGDRVGPNPVSTPVIPAGSPGIRWSGGGLSADDHSITVTGSVVGDPNGSTTVPGRPYLFIASETGDPGCTNSADGRISTNGNGQTSTGPTIGGLTQFHTYTVYACYTNNYGAAEIRLGTATAWSKPAAPTGWSYSITDHGSGGLPDFEFDTSNGQAPTGGQPPSGYTTEFSDVTTGFTADYRFPELWGQSPDIRVRYCGPFNLCTDDSQVSDRGAPYQLQVSGVTNTCQVDAATSSMTGTLSMQGRGFGAASVGITEYSYRDPDGTLETKPGDGTASVTLPPGAYDLTIRSYTITLPAGFNGSFGGRDLPVNAACATPPAGSPGSGG
jgi:hypothetical protein